LQAQVGAFLNSMFNTNNPSLLNHLGQLPTPPVSQGFLALVVNQAKTATTAHAFDSKPINLRRNPGNENLEMRFVRCEGARHNEMINTQRIHRSS
jgi:hypothetical protein